MFLKLPPYWLTALVFCLSSLRAETLIDALYFGDAASESAHRLTTDRSETIAGGLGETARRLLPPVSENWSGGKITFKLKVDPRRPNYFTVRLWGSDVNENRLILLCEGKQIGYRHLGDIDLLDLGSKSPAYNGRFYYSTSPLPVDMTKDKTEVALEIRSTGRIWGYGTSFEQYQRIMTDPTRGIYSAYIHTDGAFAPPTREKQGEYPVNPPVRKAPGPEIIDSVKGRVNKELTALLSAKNDPTRKMPNSWPVPVKYLGRPPTVILKSSKRS